MFASFGKDVPSHAVASRLFLAVLLAVAMLVPATSARALTPTVREFSSGITAGRVPSSIAAGPDGNLWFTERGPSNPAIGRIDPITQRIDEFSSGLPSNSDPTEITAARDRNLWFTDRGTTKAIGRINPASHDIDEFSMGLPSSTDPHGIAAGPDGNVWFTDLNAAAIGRIDPASHHIDEFSGGLNAGSFPPEIAPGPDGNLWFSDIGTTPAVGRVTPGGAIEEFSLNASRSPLGLASGPDGNVWFAEQAPSAAIGRINPASHAIRDFSAGLKPGSSPTSIALGADGALWFIDRGATPAIGRIETGGAIQEFPVAAGIDPVDLTTGRDGNVWFTDDDSTPAIGRITTPPFARTGDAAVLGAGAARVAGFVNGHAQPTSYRFLYGGSSGYGSASAATSAGSGIANVPAQARLSGLRPATTYHYRLAGANPTGTTAGADATFTTLPLPRVRALRVRPRIWHAGSRRVRVARKRRRPVGTRISFSLNRRARVRLRFFAVRRGRRVHGRCRPPTPRNRHARRCRRLRPAGRISFAGHKGRNRVRFQGRISKTKRLRPGRYRLTVTAIDRTVAKRSSRSATFRIVRG